MITAAQAGNTNATATWVGGVCPGATDDVNTGGFAIVQAGGALTYASLAGGGSFTATAAFTCLSVTNVPIVCNTAGAITLTLGGGYSGVARGIEVGSSATLLTLAFPGGFTNSGSGYGIYNYGTIEDITGYLINSGAGYGIRNQSTITDISVSMINSGAGYGIRNHGTITDISGSVTNSGYTGIYNSGTVSDVSGSVTNSGYTGIYNSGTVSDVSGVVMGTAGTSYTGSSPATLTGSIVKSDPALLASNIKQGVTLLTLAGTFHADILGAGML